MEALTASAASPVVPSLQGEARASVEGEGEGTPVRRGPGRPRRQVPTEQLSTRIRSDLRDDMELFRQERSMSVTMLVEKALAEYLQQHGHDFTSYPAE